jgi:hypothetical protein
LAGWLARARSAAKSVVANVASAVPGGRGARVRVALFSDSAGGSRVFRRLLDGVAHDPAPALVIHLGGAVGRGAGAAAWRSSLFAPLEQSRPRQGSAPLLFVRGDGDEDTDAEADAETLSSPVAVRAERLSTGRTPNGAARGPLDVLARRGWFARTVAGVRFVVLDAREESDAQRLWLEEEVRSDAYADADFRVALVHTPPFLEYWQERREGDASRALIRSRALRRSLVPLLEQRTGYGARARADLVLSGGSHVYQRGRRSDPVRGPGAEDAGSNSDPAANRSLGGGATSYVVMGGAGAPLADLHRDRIDDVGGTYSVTVGGRHHRGELDLGLLGGCVLRFRAVDAADKTLDMFALWNGSGRCERAREKRGRGAADAARHREM